MKIALLTFILIAGYALYEYVRIRPLLQVSGDLVRSARAYTREAGEPVLLVLGDSTAVGVGASNPEDTVAGRIAALYPEWAVENYAVSGARIEDLANQFANAKQRKYALIVIHIGANDIIRFTSAANAEAALAPILEEISRSSENVILLTAGNVGGTAFFPAVLNPFYTRRTFQYHAAFEALATRLGVSYVNLYDKPNSDPFLKEPERFHSADGLHPSSEGYRLWFEKLQKYL